MSEQLVSPQQTAQEMIRIVKERQFERLFLKNELRDHVCNLHVLFASIIDIVKRHRVDSSVSEIDSFIFVEAYTQSLQMDIHFVFL
jgi:hypothetical protein